MHQGIVFSWNEAKGYGFVTTEDGDRIFCHRSAIMSPGQWILEENEFVTFDVEYDSLGRARAVNLHRVHRSAR